MDFNIFYISGNGNDYPLCVSNLLIYFAYDLNMTSLSRSRHWWAATAFAACVARLGAVADWWRTWPMANTLTCLCSCQWWTFWTYRVNFNLFSLYLMNFMFHTTLDAVGNILRVYCKNMKYDYSFSQGSVSTLFRWGEHVIHVCVKPFFLLASVQALWKSNETFQSYDHKCTATFFMNHSVYIDDLTVQLKHCGYEIHAGHVFVCCTL